MAEPSAFALYSISYIEDECKYDVLPWPEVSLQFSGIFRLFSGNIVSLLSAFYSHINSSARQAYSSYLEHLSDLIIRQELLVHLSVSRLRNRYNGSKSPPVPGFIAVSDEEIDTLLCQSEIAGINKQKDPIRECLTSLEQHIFTRTQLSIEAGIRLPLLELARIFGLSPMEKDAVLTCLAPEIDRRFERFYGYLQDDMARKRPSIGLVQDLCASGLPRSYQIRSIFFNSAPLIRYRLISINSDKGSDNTFLSRTLQIDDRIVSFLLAEEESDPRIHSIIKLIYPEKRADDELSAQSGMEQQISAAVESCRGESGLNKRILVQFSGRDQTSGMTVARNVCRQINIPLLLLDTGHDASCILHYRDILFYTLREALLRQAAVYISDIDPLIGQESRNVSLKTIISLLIDMGSIVFISGERQWPWPVTQKEFLFLTFELKTPEFDMQIKLWKDALEFCGGISEKRMLMLLSKYPLSPEQIKNAVSMAGCSAALRKEPVSAADLDKACRMQILPDLGSLAVRVEPRHTWDDIVLPELQIKQLRDLCHQVIFRALVYGKWGFGNKLTLGSGLHALFSGPPGTGKTMAAEVLAHELQLDLFKIDLSQIVSKYIGETEKNLCRIFSQAQKGHAILLFDEADALLGKRSDVKDAHDRYANLEIAYLLQKMEEYEGISILTTNLRQNMDDAFTRRIRFIVDFPFPEEEYRCRLWKGIWPDKAPLSDDIDFELLAKRFKLAGGNIRNIALTAAFYASANGNRVEMKHLLAATREEFRKMGRLIDEKEYGQVLR